MVKFHALPLEKQNAILNAAFCCFGKSGYKKASVGDVATAAGISKASIFQYFGCKKQLYLYLFEYASDKIASETPAGTDDFFECLHAAATVKLRVMARHPGMYDFLASLVLETDEEILGELNAHTHARINMAVEGLFANVNWGKLKDGVDRQMLINAVKWVNEGYLRGAVGKKEPAQIRQELFAYLDLIKKAYYKEEYL